MSIAQKVYAIKIESIMKNERLYVFPEFMRILRKSMGFSRRMVADLLGCSLTKIVYVEFGRFGNRGPDPEFIISLAELYGLEGPFLLKKYRDYLSDPERDKWEPKR